MQGVPRARARRIGTGVLGLVISIVAVAMLVTLIDIGETVEALTRTNLWIVATTLAAGPRADRPAHVSLARRTAAAP